MNDPEQIRQAIASLNDAVAELACGLATGDQPSKGWTFALVTALAGHSRALGFAPNIEPDQLVGWEDSE